MENESKMAYMRPPGGGAASMDEPRGPSKGFVVREAPWTTGSEKVRLHDSKDSSPVFMLAMNVVMFVAGPCVGRVMLVMVCSLLSPGSRHEQFRGFPQLWCSCGNQVLPLGAQTLLNLTAAAQPPPPPPPGSIFPPTSLLRPLLTWTDR